MLIANLFIANLKAQLLSTRVLFIFLLLLMVSSADIYVQTNIGKIKGKILATYSKATVHHAFKGIPYAEPPVGNLRFKPPVPKKPLTVTWDGTREPPSCVTIEYVSLFGFNGVENCLYLNVYTTALHEKKTKLPVAVWIHGGFFFTGDSTYGQYGLDYFIDHRIVIVSMNYRLGFLGFYKNDKDVDGNMGIKDQLLSLKWVHNNIAAFGGDPEQVTLVGQSAGGACAAYLVQSPLSKGLFQRAIMQSGNSFTQWATAKKSSTALLEFHKLLLKIFDDYPNRTIPKELNFIPKLSMMFGAATNPLDGLMYAPVQERASDSAVYTSNNYEVLENCQNNSFVPILIGHNANEGHSIIQRSDVIRAFSIVLGYIYKVAYASLLPRDWQEKCGYLGQDVKDYYNLKTDREATHYVGDLLFMLPTVQYLKLYSACNTAYYLVFSYKDAGHGDDLKLLFSNHRIEGTDVTISERLMDIWSNFIKYGKPGGAEWPPADVGNNFTYMNIDTENTLLNITDSRHTEDLVFWRSVFKKCNFREESLPFIRERSGSNKLARRGFFIYIVVFFLKIVL